MEEEAPPNWSLWLYVEAVYLWELVDLSLNIEPNFLRFFPEDHPRYSRMSALRQHMARGSKILRRPSGEVFLGEPDSIHQKITVDSFRRWVAAQGWTVPPELRIRPTPVETSAEPVSAPQARHVPAAEAHEAAVLAKLKELGFDPLALPAPPRGRAYPAKQAVLKALNKSPTDSRYKKAWQRLLSAGHIRHR